MKPLYPNVTVQLIGRNSNAFAIKPLYPNVTVQLIGRDGNAFAILASVARELRREGITKEKVDDFMKEAMGGDYDNLLRVCMKWVNVR